MDLNPVLSEIQGLSPDAKAALGMAGHTVPPPAPPMAAPQIGKLLPDAGPAPATPTLSMASPPPTLGMPAQPNVEAPRGTINGDTAARSLLLGQKPGVENIAHDVETSRLGQAHPFVGKLLGGLAQGAGMLGDTLLHAAAPGAERAVPGTEGNYQRNLSRADTALTQDTTNAQKEAEANTENATAGHTEAETPTVAPLATSRENLEGAQTAHEAAETAALGKPQLEVHDTEEGPILVNKSTGVAQHVTVDGQPVGPKLQLKESQPIIGPDGKPHTYMIDEKGNKKVDLGVHYERPQVTNINAGDAALDREIKQFGAPHQKALTDAQTQLEKIADARAMVNGNAESQALGVPKVLTALVSGAGSGVRITQPELNAIATARGIKGDFQGWINQVSGKGKLTAEQQKQLTGILDDVRARISEKANISQGALDKISDPNASRADIIQADKDARKKLADFESKGHYEGQPKVYQGHNYVMGADSQWHLQPNQ